jgi:Cu-Zn family superoxide dismutase
MGSASLASDPNGVTVTIDASGLPQGMHGLHLHEKGLCEGPKFESAGAHWNPAGKKHGRDNPQGAHLGDLANLEIGADGKGTAKFLIAGATMEGANGIADADGTSLVVHAKADDYKTDPSGDSGDRIACTVLDAAG